MCLPSFPALLSLSILAVCSLRAQSGCHGTGHHSRVSGKQRTGCPPGRSPLSLAPWHESSIRRALLASLLRCPRIPRRSDLRSVAPSTGQARGESECPLGRRGAGCEQQRSDPTPVAAVVGDPEGLLGTGVGQRGRPSACVGPCAWDSPGGIRERGLLPFLRGQLEGTIRIIIAIAVVATFRPLPGHAACPRPPVAHPRLS